MMFEEPAFGAGANPGRYSLAVTTLRRSKDAWRCQLVELGMPELTSAPGTASRGTPQAPSLLLSVPGAGAAKIMREPVIRAMGPGARG
jgi:hypothetical protein